MTLPYERYSAVLRTRQWLLLNLDNKRLPVYLRKELRSLLRHYPHEYELELIAQQSDWLEAVPDQLVQMVNEHTVEVDSSEDN